MTVWSLTPFFNEAELLELRLRELDSVVDIHVISESPVTYRGEAKPLVFAEHLERFRPYLHKIRYIVADGQVKTPHQRFGPEPARWARENYQRDALGEALDGLARDDVVVLSDMDEIPRASTVAEYAERGLGGILAPPLPLYLYSTRWRIGGSAPAILRLFRGVVLLDYQTSWTGRQVGQTVEQARHLSTRDMPGRPGGPARYGWHFSYMGGIEAIRYKVTQAAHPEEDVPAWIDAANLRRCIRDGSDHRRNRPPKLVEADAAELPDAIREDPEAFRTLLDPLRYPADTGECPTPLVSSAGAGA